MPNKHVTRDVDFLKLKKGCFHGIGGYETVLSS